MKFLITQMGNFATAAKKEKSLTVPYLILFKVNPVDNRD